jgi:hypothetical protein
VLATVNMTDLDRFIPGMVDALNAEVSLGTIGNVSEAIQWLGYTYLFGASLDPSEFELLNVMISSDASRALHIR